MTRRRSGGALLRCRVGKTVRRVVQPRSRVMLRLLARHGAAAMIAYDLDRAVRDPRDLEDFGRREGVVPVPGAVHYGQSAARHLVRPEVSGLRSLGFARWKPLRESVLPRGTDWFCTCRCEGLRYPRSHTRGSGLLANREA